MTVSLGLEELKHRHLQSACRKRFKNDPDLLDFFCQRHENKWRIISYNIRFPFSNLRASVVICLIKHVCSQALTGFRWYEWGRNPFFVLTNCYWYPWRPSHWDFFFIPRKMHIFRWTGLKNFVKFKRVLLKFHTEIWTHIPQNMHFTNC